ncbi:hypothetical protein [Sulfurimonas sp. HSL-1716]|uniref:hypothetical protein n=1 Tax=Hydrocurvibacter sulfurireducens TaxID=3131937 RepID=UPI0031F857A6
MSKTITFEDIVEKFNISLEEALNMTIFVRDIELQKAQVSTLTTQVEEIRQYKCQAMKRREEERANLFFAFHNLLNSVKSCIESIICLKENEHQKGWSKFVDAEEFLDYAALQKEKLVGLEGYHQHLIHMEKCLFPQWKIFNSPGIVETIGDCNICNVQYGKCDHIEGLLYSGIVCQRINRKFIRVDHSALVEKPKDRRCIITKISTDNGYMKDYMTLKMLDEKVKNDGNEEKHMNMECILMTTTSLDIN